MGRPRFGRDPLDKLIQIRVTTAQQEFLEAQAVKRKTGVSELVREILDGYFEAFKGSKVRP